MPDAADRLTVVHEQLVHAVDALLDGSAWQRMLEVAARFHRYSPNNVLLITVQRPDATRVAGYQTWKQLDRQVRKGETGIAILAPVIPRRDSPDTTTLSTTSASAEAVGTEPPPQAPVEESQGSSARVLRGFRIAHVFDISQTDGPPLPDVRPDLLDGAAPLGVWADLLDQVEAAGFTFDYAQAASLAPANGRTDFWARTVVVRDDLAGAQQVKTLAHELAHVRLHDPSDPSTPSDLSRARAEVEAESVAHIVCAAHGLATDAYTVPYVAGWAGGDNGAARELLQQTAMRVLSTARTILSIAAPGSDGVTDPRALALARDATRNAGRTANAGADRTPDRSEQRTGLAVAASLAPPVGAPAAAPGQRSRSLADTPPGIKAAQTAFISSRGWGSR